VPSSQLVLAVDQEVGLVAAEARLRAHPVGGLAGMPVAWMIFFVPADTPAGPGGVRVGYIDMEAVPYAVVVARACLRPLGGCRLEDLAYKHTHLKLGLVVRLEHDSGEQGWSSVGGVHFLKMVVTLPEVVGCVGGGGMGLHLKGWVEKRKECDVSYVSNRAGSVDVEESSGGPVKNATRGVATSDHHRRLRPCLFCH
jgi:hypothetical protein